MNIFYAYWNAGSWWNAKSLNLVGWRLRQKADVIKTPKDMLSKSCLWAGNLLTNFMSQRTSPFVGGNAAEGMAVSGDKLMVFVIGGIISYHRTPQIEYFEIFLKWAGRRREPVVGQWRVLACCLFHVFTNVVAQCPKTSIDTSVLR